MKQFLALMLFGFFMSYSLAADVRTIDFKAVTNFCQRFCSAYNEKDVKTLGEMIANDEERHVITEECVKRHQNVKIEITEICVSNGVLVTGTYTETTRRMPNQIGMELLLSTGGPGMMLIGSRFFKLGDKDAHDDGEAEKCKLVAYKFVDSVNSGNVQELGRLVARKCPTTTGDTRGNLADALKERKVEWILPCLGLNQLRVNRTFKSFPGQLGVVIDITKNGSRVERIVCFDENGVTMGDGDKFIAIGAKSERGASAIKSAAVR